MAWAEDEQPALGKGPAGCFAISMQAAAGGVRRCVVCLAFNINNVVGNGAYESTAYITTKEGSWQRRVNCSNANATVPCGPQAHQHFLLWVGPPAQQNLDTV
jgi:hypothetical protein